MSAGSAADVLSGGTERPPQRLPRSAVLVVAALAVQAALVALVLTRGLAAVPPVAGDLAVLDDGIGVTTSGVIVLSVELRAREQGLTVRSAQITAAPVLQPATVNAPPRVRPGGTGRLVAIVQPDCRALGPGEAAPLDAELVVGVTDAARRDSELRLDLRNDPVLLGRLRGLCSMRGSIQGGASVEFLTAGFETVEAAVGVGGSDGGDGGSGAGGVEVRAITAPGLEFAPLGGPLPARVAAGAGTSLRVRVTVVDCAGVARPPPGTDPVAHVWGWPELELTRTDGTVATVRPDPAAVSELYSTAVRRIVENGCDGPPR